MTKTSLEARFLEGNERALARGISLLEGGDAAGQTLLRAVRARGGGAHIVGVTGSPGSGKSTLTDALIVAARAQSKRVAVLAVDPTSPYSGGAILGDRIRMMRHHRDAGVFIRSMATRGQLGGLAAATLQVTALLGRVRLRSDMHRNGRRRAIRSRYRAGSPTPPCSPSHRGRVTACRRLRRASWRSPTCSSSTKPTSQGPDGWGARSKRLWSWPRSKRVGGRRFWRRSLSRERE